MGNARVARHPERAVRAGGDAARYEIKRHGPLLVAVSGKPYQPTLDRVVLFRSGGAIRTRCAGEQREPPLAERAEAENLSRRSIDGDRSRLAVGGGATEFVERLPLAFLMLLVLSLRGLQVFCGLEVIWGAFFDFGRGGKPDIGHFGRLARRIGKPGEDRCGCIGNHCGSVSHVIALPCAGCSLKRPHRLSPAVHSLPRVDRPPLVTASQQTGSRLRIVCFAARYGS